jgi:single-stranded-DNA-specific exonuclease
VKTKVGIRGRRWQMRGPAPPGALMGLPCPPLVRHLLWWRGVRSLRQAHAFLGEEPEEHSPWSLPDLERAVVKLRRAIEGGELIAVFGDFDVDGVTAAALLSQALQELGGQVVTYIPDRFREGYGLNLEAVSQLRRRGASLLLAADCGTTALAEVAAARRLGLEVVVLDHHTITSALPEGAEVVNPKRPDSCYPHPDLASVGLAYKLAQALHEALGRPFPARRYLDLVALGTITDLVPLVGENRWLVREGLKALQHTSRPGLHYLMEEAGLRGRAVDVWAIGWVLGPRLNAAGRLAHASQALRLLLTPDEAEARALAQELCRLNQERQRLTDAALALAYELLGEGPQEPIVLVGHQDISLGVVGLVASRLCDELYRPAFVYAQGQELVRASGRSIPEVDLASLLRSCGGLFVKFGGHRQAAGFTALSSRLPEIREALLEGASKALAGVTLAPVLHIDAHLPLRSLRGDVLPWLQKLAPHGPGNPEPIFLTQRVEVVQARPAGPGGRHLRLKLKDGDVVWPALAQSLGSYAPSPGQRVDVVYSLAPAMEGQGALELRVHDMAPC